MATIANPQYNSSAPVSSTNQPYIFDNPNTIINPTLGQTAFQAASPITSASLTPQVPVQLPAQLSVPNYQAAISSIPSIESIMAETPSATETNQTNLSNRILGLYSEMSGKTAAQLRAEQTAGLPEYKTQLTDINNQIQTLQKESQAQNLALEKQISGGGALTAGSMDFLNKQQQEVNRQYSIKALGLSAIAQTLQGNIASAQETADKAVELEFAPKQAQIDYLNKAIELNENKLNREDKKQAIKQQALLTERQRLLDQQKEDRSIILSWVAEASKNGAPSVIINQALNMSDPRQAMSLLNQYFVDPIAKEQALADLEYKRTQTEGAKLGMEIDKSDLALRQSADALAWAKFRADIASKGAGNMTDPVTGKIITSASDLKIDALESAKQLLEKFNANKGTSAVGKSGFLNSFGYGLIPGTENSDFKVQFGNLKSLLSLDNVKLLKGQGQVSDAERRLLAEASAKLELNQSEPEFKKALEAIITSLSGDTGTPIDEEIEVISPDGIPGTIPIDQLQEALNQGYTLP